ncbi:MAG: hypothetical protein GYB66_13070 [Chloroflexi bacterium]|nr:hypothetical protein [Chloroflexota bacterium]
MRLKLVLVILMVLLTSGCWWFTVPPSQDDPGPTPKPPSPTPAPEQYDSAVLDLTVEPNPVVVGEEVRFRLTLANHDVYAAGIPKFSLQGDQMAVLLGTPVAGPENDGVLYGAVAPGESHQVVWTFIARAPGTVTVQGHVSFEVHEGYPGPAYWRGTQSSPVSLRVVPR